MSGLLKATVIATSPLTVQVIPSDVVEPAETSITGLALSDLVYVERLDETNAAVVLGKKVT